VHLQTAALRPVPARRRSQARREDGPASPREPLRSAAPAVSGTCSRSWLTSHAAERFLNEVKRVINTEHGRSVAEQRLAFSLCITRGTPV